VEYEFEVAGQKHKVTLEKQGESFIVDLGNKALQVNCLSSTPNTFSLFINNRTYIAHFIRVEDQYYISIRGEYFFIKEAPTGKTQKRADDHLESETGGEIGAPMPGRILKIMVSEGQSVQKGQVLFIVEAMKMEHNICSPANGA